jgi:hypothetical protein
MVRESKAACQRTGLLLLGLLVALAGFLAHPCQVAADDLLYYLPIIGRQHSPCHPTAMEQALANLMIADPQQQRPILRCNPILEEVAQGHAADMAEQGYVGYVTPEGTGMNDLVRQAGYVLPAAYSTAPGANQVASIAVGQETASGAWAGLTDPIYGPQTRSHVLGLEPFYARQIDYGIGHAYDLASVHGHYWVIIAAEPVVWPPGPVRPTCAPGRDVSIGIESIVIRTR